MFRTRVLIALCSSLLGEVLANPLSSLDNSQVPLTEGDNTRPLRYAAFGDSWAAGINYGRAGKENEYDFPDGDEVCRCRRSNYAYAVQLRDDDNKTWADNRTIELDFHACNGASFDDIPAQVEALEDKPDFATLMIGGNDAGFPDLIEDCIFQYNPNKDYGPWYPDPEGACYKTLRRIRNTLDTAEFSDGALSAIRSIISSPLIKPNANFRLYVISYAALFNAKYPYCTTFGLLPGKKQPMTFELRKDINDIAESGIKLYDRLINHVLFEPRVRFLDVNNDFEGHRFCEPNPDEAHLTSWDKSWFWSLEWPSCIPLEAMTNECNASDEQDLWHATCTGFCRKCGGWNRLGEVLRVFHPKPEGHDAIKNRLRDSLEAEPLF